jgi:aminoglycoside 3-N-acetyltransferase
MNIVRVNQIISILNSLDIHKGDGVMVHSALQFLGKPEDGVVTYYSALNTVLEFDHSSPSGALAVPTFNFAFARGEAYDSQTTPSQGMGAFSEYVRQLPLSRRTHHPLQSIAVIGLYANELAERDTPSAFDLGSAIERMLELDFKLLFLGADIQAVSLVHYSEQRARVPYRYWKDFTGQVRFDDDWETRTYRMYARDLNLDPQLILQPIQKVLEDRNQWHSMPLNYGAIAVCRMRDFVEATDDLLTRDPWILVSNINRTPASKG